MKRTRPALRFPFTRWPLPHPPLEAAKGLAQTIWKRETKTEISITTTPESTEISKSRWSTLRRRIQKRPGVGSASSTSSTNKQHEVPKLADLVDQNIETIITLHMHAELQVSQHQRFLERVTAKLGRPAAFYITLLAVALWVLINTKALPLHLPILDPAPFAWLQGLIGLGALLMTILVLTTQNRQAKMAERRKHLDLQVNLVVEHKVSKLIALMEELRRDIPNVKDRYDEEAEVMSEAVDPEAMFLTLDASLEEVSKEVEQTVLQSEFMLDVGALFHIEKQES